MLTVTCEEGTHELSDLDTAEFCENSEVSIEVCALWDGDQPFTWALTDGALPTGLTLNGGTLYATCVTITGIPSELGEFTFTITGTDAEGNAASKEYTISIVGFTDSGTLPNGTQGDGYSFTFSTDGTEPPVTFTAIGELPPGLTLNQSTGELSGVPIVAGTYVFEIAVSSGVPPPSDAAVIGDYQGNRVADYDDSNIQSRQP